MAVTNLSRLGWMWIPNQLAEIVTTPSPQPVNGELEVPERPGLGSALDRKKFDKFKLS